jgi:hypothetical protein
MEILVARRQGLNEKVIVYFLPVFIRLFRGFLFSWAHLVGDVVDAQELAGHRLVAHQCMKSSTRVVLARACQAAVS